MISPMITPSTAVFQSEGSVSDELVGRQRELADAVIDVFARQLKLIHAMMVELPFAWVTRSASEPLAGTIPNEPPAPAMASEPPAPAVDAPPAGYSPPAVDETPLATQQAVAAANLDPEDLLPATRKRKASTSGEAAISQAAPKATGNKPPGKKPTRKGPPPAPLH